MSIRDLFQETYSALSVNKARSGLTILGIVIGIASVIAMVSVGQGVQGSVTSRIESIGSNLLLIYPGTQRGVGAQISAGRGSAQTLTLDDAKAISSGVNNIAALSPEDSRRFQIEYSGQNTNTQVIGTVPIYLQTRNVQIDIGSFFTDQNVQALSRVAVLGPTTRDDLFGQNADPTDQMIRIKNINFKVIGVTKSKGGTGFGNQDDMILVPLTTAQHYLTGDTFLTTIDIQVQDQSSMSQAQQDITNLLLDRHRISDPTLADFSVLNQSDIISTVSAATQAFTILLGSIAGISLLVGGIGIMNMMLTTVTERTREIGLRKAVGAKRKDISLQFLSESIMLTIIGGIIGIGIGWLAAYLISHFSQIPTSVSWSSILLAFGVSGAVGIIFGYYPSRRAAGLNPIEALRYE